VLKSTFRRWPDRHTAGVSAAQSFRPGDFQTTRTGSRSDCTVRFKISLFFPVVKTFFTEITGIGFITVTGRATAAVVHILKI
jgi:hypothetical protein